MNYFSFNKINWKMYWFYLIVYICFKIIKIFLKILLKSVVMWNKKVIENQILSKIVAIVIQFEFIYFPYYYVIQ
jgi:hypothetical protein